jgi:hypothetical protein
MKQGGRVKSWKKRWFIIHDNHLLYYDHLNVCAHTVAPVLL